MVIQATQEVARKAIESRYIPVMTVEEYRKVTNKITKLTSSQSVIVVEAQPCRISFIQRLRTSTQIHANGAVSIDQTVRLFTAPEIVIKPNSKITVTQTGRTTEYICSGVPAVYETHQEVILELAGEWA